MHEDIRFSARDGVRLYARRYRGSRGRRPVLCLPTLAGNSDEFAALAEAVSRNGPESRTVFTIDGRGRGRSEAGSGPPRAQILTDCEDALELMTLAGLDDALIVGNGHGGQLAMILALLRPRSVGALVLNDSAPEFEAEGVVRLLSEITNLPLAATWSEAAALLKALHGRRYPRLSDAQWLGLAKSRYTEIGGRPARGFDLRFAASLSLSRGNIHRQSLWPQFAAMARVPMLLLRTEFSDLVSKRTVDRMRDLHPTLEEAKIPAEGHPALLSDPVSIALVAKFLMANEWMDKRSELPLRAVA